MTHKGLRLVRNHILHLTTWSWIRAPGAGDKPAPSSSLDRTTYFFTLAVVVFVELSHCAPCLSNKAEPHGSRRLVGYVALSGFPSQVGQVRRGAGACIYGSQLASSTKVHRIPRSIKYQRPFLGFNVDCPSFQTCNLTTSEIDVQKCITFPAPRLITPDLALESPGS